ncbi:unnamed protein product [Plutella xylostella]|uniref:(diamondback moth) hypothetical protein n=1 Tax=Plutella xylostella TaxID=51655 RepID=A0A8S4FJL7_PLUXY|nr:unnamed protein product [Plutella xylostella]
MSDIVWTTINDHLEAAPNSCEYINNFLETLQFCGLQQFNNIKNEFNRILDLAICNENEQVLVDACSDPFVPEDPHHKALSITFTIIDLKPLRPLTRLVYSYNRADYTVINDEICNIDWLSILSCGSVEEAVIKFYDVIYKIRDNHIAQRTGYTGQYPPWYSRALSKAIKEKFKFHKKYKKYGNLCDKATFELLRERVKRLEKQCYDSYMSRIENSLHTNPKAFWSFIKNKRKGSSFPSTMNYLGNSSSSGDEISNLFSSYFHSTFLQPEPDQNADGGTVDDATPNIADVSSIEITEDVVHKLLSSIDPNKSAGPDDLPAIFLIKCSKSLSVPIATLFRRSLAEGVVPLIWKSAFISPIHKKGPKNQVDNYRPISKLCLVAKVFERIVYNEVYVSLKLTFNHQQHGFLRHRSTVSNLVLLNEFISKEMESNNNVDAIYTDYSKAFDRIDHKMLLKKLLMAGIRGDLYRWFSSYICNRTQAVVLNGYKSLWTDIPSGVPQGSLLGPLLFVIFINDIDTCFRYSDFLLFADDMKVFRVVNDSLDCSLLQDDLDRVEQYCHHNKLDINVSKCFSITFSRKRNIYLNSYKLNHQSISNCSEIRDLGVTMDSKLMFDTHIQTIVKKSYKALGFLIRSCKNFKMMKSIKILYCSLVRSNLEYASQVWNPLYNVYISQIESIQRKFIKYLGYKFRIPKGQYEFMCNKLHLLPLYIRRDAADIAFILKIAQNKIDCPDLLSKINILAPDRQMRQKTILHVPVVHTNYRQNSFLLRASRSFNSLTREYPGLDLFVSNPKMAYFCLTDKFSSKFVK